MRSIIYRILFLIAAFFLFRQGLVDYQLNTLISNPKSYTLPELFAANEKQIEDYFVVKDVKLYADKYVAHYDKATSEILSVTYPLTGLSADSEAVKLLVTDYDVSNESIEDGSYFGSLDTEISGWVNMEGESDETLSLLEDKGIAVSPSTIYLTKGKQPLGYAESIFVMVFASLIMALMVYSFVPVNRKRLAQAN
ncbi:hypothetical protein V6R21_19655 [Limibacter armeniacum]|uniref:hypothetical protein n=1 Tax=Limibacter armeniacum TaxID=466084 RepID=UPI002FE53A02